MKTGSVAPLLQEGSEYLCLPKTRNTGFSPVQGHWEGQEKDEGWSPPWTICIQNPGDGVSPLFLTSFPTYHPFSTFSPPFSLSPTYRMSTSLV